MILRVFLAFLIGAGWPIRSGWVVATIFSQGTALIPYIALSMILKDEEEVRDDDDPLIRFKSD